MTAEARQGQRIAVVTGAAGAIGGAVAQRFAELGYAVALVDRADTQIPRPSKDCLVAQADVRSRAEVDAAIRRTLDEFGRVDVLVNVAGITSFGSAASLSEAEWQRVLDINLTGTFRCCQAVIPAMQAQHAGRIINLGSVLGKNGGNAKPWLNPEEQQGSANVAYGVSKAGVHAMTAYLAKELAPHGITVNAVAPGPVRSPMTTRLSPTIATAIPLGRMGDPAEVAAVVCFLASESAAFITGEVIDLNGGMWCD